MRDSFRRDQLINQPTNQKVHINKNLDLACRLYFKLVLCLHVLVYLLPLVMRKNVNKICQRRGVLCVWTDWFVAWLILPLTHPTINADSVCQKWWLNTSTPNIQKMSSIKNGIPHKKCITTKCLENNKHITFRLIKETLCQQRNSTVNIITFWSRLPCLLSHLACYWAERTIPQSKEVFLCDDTHRKIHKQRLCVWAAGWILIIPIIRSRFALERRYLTW